MRIRRQRLKKTKYTVSKDEAAAVQPTPSEGAAEETFTYEPGPLPEEPEWSEVPFSPPDPEAAYAALKAFYEEHPCSVTLRSQTGLPAYLYGDLQDPQGGRPLDAAEAFLGKNELMLAGLSRETRLRRVRESDWDDGTYQVTFSQTNRERMPLYGSNVVCNFTAGRLTLVMSTLYPAPAEVIDNLDWGNTSWLEAKGAALKNLPPGVRPVGFEAPHNLREESREQGWLVDRWILPYQPPGEEQGIYRPIWRVVIVDENGERWLALVDAEVQAVLFQEPTWVDATVRAEVYLTAQDAKDGRLSTVTLDYGTGKTKMAKAELVHVSGARFVEPTGGNAVAKLRHLSATAFYHTCKIQGRFKSWLAGLSFSSSDPGGNPDPTEDIKIALEDRVGSAVYDFSTHTICLRKGTSQGNPRVFEPGFDCEVVYHEFTHAVARYLNPGVFNFANYAQKRFTRAMDEGLAFYFPCAFAGDARWAEYAYQEWVNPATGLHWRDLVDGPKTPGEATGSGDPADVFHALGMWWARVFWALRANDQLGAHKCDRLLLKALLSLSGPIDSVEAFATALMNHAAHNDKSKVKAILSQFGVDL